MTSKKVKFVHLRNYSQYSLSKGALRINELVDFCKAESIPAAAISDYNNLFGCLEFCMECSKSGVQPIIGVNILIKNDIFKDGNILLICKNEQGYKNLVKLVSNAYLCKSKLNNPHISFNDLLEYKHGLICLAGGVFGILTNNFQENPKLSDDLIKFFKKNFKDDFFLKR